MTRDHDAAVATLRQRGGAITIVGRYRAYGREAYADQTSWGDAMRQQSRHLTIGRSVSAGVLLAWLVVSPAKAEPAQFTLDPEHTSITFFTHHIGFADLAGMFLESEGSFTYDEETRELSNLEIVVDTESIFTNHEERDEHMRSPDFLNVEEFPEMTFVARSAEPLSETTGRITGELTLLGVTRPVTFEARLNKAGRYPFGDEHYAIGVDATGSIRRSEFGMTYAVENGWVGDEIRIVLGFEAKRQE
jgi:polyisoprenoid-binding protein YceI